ncbi:MAG: polysaccharide biosynthesis tyrosine autokinase [Ardenticatenaceae bacterium]|nr:polysaccharide biosynthesis tyrosine autokinase [Anaerolineales bacterium]MCB8921275.1 polysaccharide biosynthesis tyrosine autokinase [Ardenticatenaceae bacterium]MCB8990641.1 polysaccharide biosynthesis tyrosine autokinase [Ardenticatenaceae bacterium]
MELREYVSLFLRWLWLIVLGALVAGASAFLISRSQTPIYKSTAVLLVSEGAADSNEYRSLLVGEQLAQSYVARLTNYEVLKQAIANLGLDMEPATLKAQTQVNLLSDTQLIELSVSHTNPQIASDLANEIPRVFAERNINQQLERFASSKSNLETEIAKIESELQTAESILESELQKGETDQILVEQANNNVLRLRDTHSSLVQSYENVRIAEASSLNTIVIDEAARPSNNPVSPRVISNTLLATAVGGMLAIGIVFLIEYLDDTIKNPLDIERETGLTPLGSIERMKINHAVDALVVATDPRSPTSEGFRHIRTNIQYISVDRPLRTLLVTSANMSEGKSTVSINLATSLAQSGKQVILVDADMRRPMLHRLLEVDGSRGLANLIIRGREDTSFLKGTLIANLRVLPAGRIPPNPAELLGSERMKEVIAWLEQQADYVIFDSPPLLAVTDGAVLSQVVDTTIMVASSQTHMPAFIAAAKKIAALESHIAGVILNKVNPRSNHGYYYYYRTEYRADRDDGDGNGRKTLKEIVQHALYFLNILH